MADKKKSNRTSPRARNFCGVLYPEDMPLVNERLTILTNDRYIKYWHKILHQGESDSEEDIDKKEHIHILIECYNAHTNTAISNKLGLNRSTKIQTCSNVQGYAKYMLHKFEFNKTTYKIEQVESSDVLRFMELVNAINDFNVSTFKDKVLDICKAIKQTNYTRYNRVFDKLVENYNVDVQLLISKHKFFYDYWQEYQFSKSE